MRAKFPQPDGRGIVPRKWPVEKRHGPLVLLCELVLKKLIQHGWPAVYVCDPTNRLYPLRAVFSNEGGETPEFLAALQMACDICGRKLRVRFVLEGVALVLDGEWVVRLRYHGDPHKPVAASIHPAPDCPF